MNIKSLLGKLLASIKKHPIVTLFFAVCVFIPLFITNNYWQRLIGEVFFYAALASAWNIIGGYARQISWAHASFFAVGAYSGVVMYSNWGISPWIGMLVGIVLSVVLAVIIGMPTFKLRGTYFAIATIAACTIVERLLLYFKGFTGGATGLSLPNNRVYTILTLNFKNALPYFYIAFGLMTIAVIVSSLVQRSRLGFYLRMIREDEDATESLGIRTYQVKLIALIISAVLTAAIGTFFAFRLRYVDPPTFASHDVAVRIGMTAIIGGMGTLWGPILGAVLTVPLLQLSNAYFGSIGGGGLAWIIYGTIIILFVLFQPNGLIALTNKVLAFVKRLALKKGILKQRPPIDKLEQCSDEIETEKQIPSDKDKSL